MSWFFYANEVITFQFISIQIAALHFWAPLSPVAAVHFDGLSDKSGRALTVKITGVLHLSALPVHVEAGQIPFKSLPNLSQIK